MRLMKVTPDLLTFDDATPVRTADWNRRRMELRDAIIPHEYGELPPPGQHTEVVLRAANRIRNWPGIQYRTYDVTTRFESGNEFSLTLSLWCPPGDGPFPVVLNGDGCWRYFDDSVIRQVVARGNIAASFDRTQAAADNKDAYRQSGLYRIFPEAHFAVLAVWAWAFHRCVDALLGMRDVRADGIAVTGHSRGGKAALLAGATDDRIALTNPNCSGIGGASLHRRKAPGSEVVDDFYHSGNIFWFAQGFRDHRHRDAQFPYDQHFLHALVAPRLLLITDAYDDHAANPPGTYAACQAAREVYDMLGRPDGLGWSIREGGHAHTWTDFEALLDFMDLHLHRRMVQRQFQRRLFPDLDTLLAIP